MIQSMHNERFEIMERPTTKTPASSSDFAELFGNVAKTPAPADTVGNTARTIPGSQQPALGDPDVQGWLNSYYTQQGAPNAANTSYQPATGAPNNYPDGSVYGPDQIFAQALANQDGNVFATMAGSNAAQFTSQLPGVPSQQAQQEFDRRLALENVSRLQSGQPIDTTAYWSDPGPITTGGVTYTSKELGYAGPGQSSGPQPIYISIADKVAGGAFTVPGYSGTVTGVQPGRYYTLAQLEQAGLKTGQPDGQFHPGSWSETTTETTSA